ncbi:MAG: glycerate kinase [Christensenellaceae bacterium]|nr:glycerate kinase [Christensenellaceae bacterium]
MEVLRFGLGIRFETFDAGIIGKTDDHNDGTDAYSEEPCRTELLTQLFSVLYAKDVSGLKLYGGYFKLDDSDSESIYTVVFMNGGVKKTRKLFLKFDSDARIRGMLASYRPYIQTNVLRRVEGLTYFGEFNEDGTLMGGEVDLGIRVMSKRENKMSVSEGKGLTILLAPDKFKGSMSADTVVRLLTNAARRIMPDCRVIPVPIADGGDGTVNALVRSFDGILRSTNVTAPNGGTVRAEYGVIGGDTAIIEMASASGLALVPDGERDPLNATSRGTGELIVRALNEGMKRILIGIGGSATNDGGMGAAIALGAKFFDSDGNELSGMGSDLLRVESMDLSGLHPRLRNCDIIVMCDVENPLTGKNGATYTYGTQKGADDGMLKQLEVGMKRIERIYDAHAGRSICSEPGSGAAGGMGAMLAVIAGARLTSGAEAVLEAVHFNSLLSDADIVITGEGMLDETSACCGKAVGTVVSHAKAKGVPTFVIAGCLGKGYENIFNIENVGLYTCVDSPMTAKEAIENAEALLDKAAERLYRSIRLLRGV